MSEKRDDKKEMSFLQHLEELRWHLVKSAIAILVFTIVAFVFNDFVFDKIIFVVKEPHFITNVWFCKLFTFVGASDFCATELPVTIQSQKVTGQFMKHISVSIIAGVIIAFPYIFYQVWSFIKPGLKPQERKLSRGVIFLTSILFFFGILFGYFIIAPLSLQFFGNYSLSPDIENIFTLESVISMIVTSTFAAGLIFLLPIVIYFFSKIGIVTPAFLKKYRKHSIVAVLVLAALITPPDVFSQVLVAIPIMILYEISIGISARIHRKSTAEIQ